jgi:hypothetical protein
MSARMAIAPITNSTITTPTTIHRLMLSTSLPRLGRITIDQGTDLVTMLGYEAVRGDIRPTVDLVGPGSSDKDDDEETRDDDPAPHRHPPGAGHGPAGAIDLNLDGLSEFRRSRATPTPIARTTIITTTRTSHCLIAATR